MLKRFYELIKEIKMALVQLDVQVDVSEEEIIGIAHICEALTLQGLLLMLQPLSQQTYCCQKIFE